METSLFLAPEALHKVGYIPLSSNSALAARTARESRPEMNNKFAAVRHASVFEGIKVGNASAEAIQKIISAPILSDGRVVGIIQISRKGTSLTTAGPDFTPTDLGQILALCKPLGKLLRHVAQARKSNARLNYVFISSKCVASTGIALTVQYLLVTFPQRKIFSIN